MGNVILRLISEFCPNLGYNVKHVYFHRSHKVTDHSKIWRKHQELAMIFLVEK